MEDPKSNSTAGRARPRLLRNWVSLAGLVVALGSPFSFLLLFVLDTFAHFSPTPTLVGSYRTYQFTESVEFCGQACHTVKKAEG